MNDIFREQLLKFVLVFFDNILVYSSSTEEHLNHLTTVFNILQQHELKVKNSKCSFGASKVEYLGHVISSERVAVDPAKIEVIKNWSKPKTLKGLRGFLGLAGYYRKYVKHFGIIAKPLTNMLKKDGFKWSQEAEEASEKLKIALTTTLVLALPDFSKEFVVECDASGVGIGAVLSQEKHLIAYLSKTLGQKHLDLSVYDKEMSGSHNTVPDALSRQGELKTVMGISTPVLSFMQIIKEFHEGKIGGHSGWLRTYKRISKKILWPRIKKQVRIFVSECIICQRNHYEAISPPGLLQPNSIPTEAWLNISLDFIDGLPVNFGKSDILVVVDRLTKYGHFVALSHPYTAKTIAEVFVREVFHLHGMPKEIISDRDPTFLSTFWKEFFAIQGTKLCYSTTYHPQTDGQTESLNRVLEQYLRCTICEKVIKKIGKVAYKLLLPSTAKIHPVFHVSRLKKKVGSAVITSLDLPLMFESDKSKWYPAKILDRGIFKKNNAAVTKWLVPWKNTNEEDATWEDPEQFMNRFPEFQT
ncbi:uncharacterized protein LOC133711581 [Rosa rugosa]|uniref:uncharacterized protein LOC133711581 n=1 Tax=Rosa rugosa TaxID=74645 RepID=UPI002B40945D|nr:uncharacterized protein LOC133711581 [Rosa rugosa]